MYLIIDLDSRKGLTLSFPALFPTSIQISITEEDIDRIFQESSVDKIFPEVTAENDPWNAGGIVEDKGKSAWNEDAGWNNEETDTRLVVRGKW